jgi:hypothetical protein
LHGWAYSSAGEHYIDIVGVTGSIPVTPTIHSPSIHLDVFLNGHLPVSRRCVFRTLMRFALVCRFVENRQIDLLLNNWFHQQFTKSLGGAASLRL